MFNLVDVSLAALCVRCAAFCFIGYCFFFFTVPPTTKIYTLSLHDALPISNGCLAAVACFFLVVLVFVASPFDRSEEHTSELQSRVEIVCRLLLEKKNSWPVCLIRHKPFHTALMPIGPS